MFRVMGLLVAIAFPPAGDTAFSQTSPAPKSPSVKRDAATAPGIPKKSAQQKPAAKFPAASAPQLSVDVVKLNSGKSLRGAVVRQHADGSLTMAVSREWLRSVNPELLMQLEADEVSIRRTALEQLRDRINKELVGLPDGSQLGFFLRSEQKRVDALLRDTASVKPPQFVWKDLPKKQIAKVSRASIERQRVAAWSWYDQLANVETRSSTHLADELKGKGIDPVQIPPDLSERFPPRLQDEREWGARMAIITYALDTPLDFQGTGDVLMRADRSAKGPNMATFVASLLGGQVDSILKDFLGEGRPAKVNSASSDDWLKPAIRDVEKDNARAFRATRVDVNLPGRQAVVTTAFVAKLGKDQWEAIWSHRDTQDGAQERAALESTITDDPGVKSALESLKALGAAGDDQIRQAIRFGAATMAAQQAVDDRFFAFRDPLLKRLDGPPLWRSK